MITVFYRQNESIKTKKLNADDSLPADSLWVDVESPSANDLYSVEKSLNIRLPSTSDVWRNHTLNRLYSENGVAYMTAALITKVNSPYPDTGSITFILTQKSLITIREIAPTSFNIFSERMQALPEKFKTPAQTFEGLLEEIITRVAHNREIVDETLDDFSHRIFGGEVLEKDRRNPSKILKEVLKEMGACADLNSKISESLQSLNRLLHFFKQSVAEGSDIYKNIDVMISDTNVLNKQTDFAAAKISFQLDAIMGMINIEQNIIIKLFSVITVFFVPPTFVAGLYGMNFRHMPELEWQDGYPMAIILMILFATAPYLYFRKKGWL